MFLVKGMKKFETNFICCFRQQVEGVIMVSGPYAEFISASAGDGISQNFTPNQIVLRRPLRATYNLSLMH